MRRILVRKIAPAALFLSLLSGGWGAAWQEQSKPRRPGAAFSVQTQLVQVYLTVTDGKRAVAGLEAADFSVSEDGRPKNIERLDSDTVPLNIALLLDTSESMRESLPVTKEAAAFFVESMTPHDRVTFIPFGSEIMYVPQQSDDRSPILTAIRNSQDRGGTQLYEAILFAMKYLNGQEGRKAVVLFSDGEDTARRSSLEIVLSAAARYGYPIYTIGAGAGLERDSLRRVLRQLADINSGRTYYVEDPRDLRAAFLEVALDLRSAYVLSYYTDVPTDGRWHDIKVSVADSRYAAHTRKGFYARDAGSGSPFAPGPANKGLGSPAVKAGSRAWKDDEMTVQAVSEFLKPAPTTRAIDPGAAGISGQAPSAAAQPSIPVFKVETHFVEVPVLLESETARELPALSEKNFRVYEDEALQEIAFFSKADGPRDISQLREAAMAKIRSKGAPSAMDTAPAGEVEKLLLGRYYLALDDMMTETSAFLRVKDAAEKIVRTYSSPVRPVSLYFTSQSQAAVSTGDDVENMLARIRNARPPSNHDLTSNEGIMSIYEAYLIERGDVRARQLAELRLASKMNMRYRNELGEVDGDVAADPLMVVSDIQSHSRALMADNFAQVARALSGLRAVASAAASEPGNYPKTIIFISSGFSLGRTSGRANLSSMMDAIVQAAKRAGVRIYAIDALGLDSTQPLETGANGTFFAHNPQLGSLLEDHAQGWRREKESALTQLASDTGGRFVHSTNDLVGGAGAAIRTTGQLYYIGYLSRQPADGRFHRIRVAASLRSARLHAREGYFAGRQNNPETLAATSPGGEDWETLISRANAARAAGNHSQLAASLDQLVRRFPNDVNLWYNLGAARLRLNNPQRAVEALQKAFSLSPEDKQIGSALARAFVAAGARDAAAETLELIQHRFPQDVELLAELGLVYEASARTQEAYQVYRKVLDVTSAPPLDFYLLLIRTSLRLGRPVEAGLLMEDYLARGGSEASLDPWRRLLGSRQ